MELIVTVAAVPTQGELIEGILKLDTTGLEFTVTFTVFPDDSVAEQLLLLVIEVTVTVVAPLLPNDDVLNVPAPLEKVMEAVLPVAVFAPVKL